MSGGKNRNVALGLTNRPGSARRTTEKDPLQRNALPATSSSEVDISTFINALKTIQKVDLSALRIQSNSTVPHDLKYGQNGQDVSARWAENVDWKTKYMDIKWKYDNLAKQIEEKQEVEDKQKNLQAQRKMTEQISLEQNNEIVLLQQRVESGDKDLKDLNQKLQECINDLKLKEKKLQIQQLAMEEAQKAKEDALTRLSRQMGRQMSEGNPNIADLSDQNRPSKLGEMYSQLYDNEWTDTFEVLTETFHLDDKSSIQLLLKILWESSKHASDVSQSTMKAIEKLLSGSSDGVTNDCKRLLREARKHVDIKKADSLFQDFREKLTTLVDWKYLRQEKVEVYIKTCFQLCWLMSIQDPPVVLSRDPERGAQLDTNLYKHYMHSGHTIDYVIWPALLLHTDGPLLAKGVAEPCTIPKVKSAPATAKDDTFFDKRSQIKYDGKVRDSTCRSGKMDTTQYGNDAPFSSVHDSKYRFYSETPSTRGQSPVPNDNLSFDKRSQIKHDEKVQESTSGSSGMDTTQYGNDAPYSSKPGYSPIVTQKYPIHDSKDRFHSETPSTRGQSPVSKDNLSFYKRSQIKHDEKVRVSTSGPSGMDTTQYGNDATFSSKSRFSPIVTQTYPVHDSKYRVHSETPSTRGQIPVSEQMQLYQHDVFTSRNDQDRCLRFCQGLLNFKESTLRSIYGRDYDRYYMIYSKLKYGHQKFT